MAINYVKFQRGNEAAYKALLANNSYDNNTLYFIHNEELGTVSLYMGNKLITDNSSNVANALKDLTDVNIADALSDSFLVKESDGKWVAKTPYEVATLIQEHLNIENPIELDGDNLSVELTDNIIHLKNYGTQYYAFVPAVIDAETGEVREHSKYTLTQGFKAGLEPRVEEINGKLELAWYEPSNENIDGINSNIQIINNNLSKLETMLGVPSTGSSNATGVYASIEDLAIGLNQKANSKDVYTKIATDQAIAAAIAGVNHLQRKKVNSVEDIDVTIAGAENYIYMVATGLPGASDKYNEYMVIDGAVEKVGSWDVNLDNYATKDDLLITSLSEDFFVNNKQLNLNKLSVNKLDDLEEWLNNNAGKVKGLSENNLTDEFFEKLSSSLLIKSIDNQTLSLTDGHLKVNKIDYSKIIGLDEALSLKAEQSQVTKLETKISTIDEEIKALAAYKSDIEEIKEILTWQDI